VIVENTTFKQRFKNYKEKNPKKFKLYTFLFFGTIVYILSFLDEPPTLINSIMHFVRCTWSVLWIIADYKYYLRNNEERNEEELKKIHLRSAKRLLDSWMKNGGIFIKFGQHIASLNNVLPPGIKLY
jgi:hypothetical protein